MARIVGRIKSYKNQQSQEVIRTIKEMSKQQREEMLAKLNMKAVAADLFDEAYDRRMLKKITKKLKEI